MSLHTIPATPRASERFTNAQIIALAKQHGFTRRIESDMGMVSWETLCVQVGDGTTITIDDIHPLYQHAAFAPPSPDWDVISWGGMNTKQPELFSRAGQSIGAIKRTFKNKVKQWQAGEHSAR